MSKLTVPFFISHRGCPHRCVFCDQVKISGSAEEIPKHDEIIDRIGQYERKAGGRVLEVAFFGGSFTGLPQFLQDQLLLPLQPLLRSGRIGSVRISTRPDSITSESAAFLKEMGVGVVELGVQSMDEGVLALSGREHGCEIVKKSVALLKNHGFSVGIQLMPGLPGDSSEKSIDSLRKALALNPAFLRIYPTLVIAGTPLESFYRSGSYAPMTLDEAVGLCKVMLVDCLRAGVPVIRMGLQSTAEIMADGVIVAGPWHPAFRQLVEGEVCFDLLCRMIDDLNPSPKSVQVFCSPSRVSDVLGQKRKNAEKLLQLGVLLASVKPDPAVSPLEMKIVSECGAAAGKILDLYDSGLYKYSGGC